MKSKLLDKEEALVEVLKRKAFIEVGLFEEIITLVQKELVNVWINENNELEYSITPTGKELAINLLREMKT